MAEISNNYSPDQVGTVLSGLQPPVYQSTHIYQGQMVCLTTAGGYAVGPVAGSCGAVQGVAKFEQDNSSGSSGDLNIDLLCGEFVFDNYSTHPLTQADAGKICYAYNGRTISRLSSDGPRAGTFLGFTAAADGTPNTNKVRVYINPAGVGVEDAATMDIPFAGLIIAAGTPLAAFADGASTTPGLSLNDSKAYGVRWNNHATPAAVYGKFTLPKDIDTSAVSAIKVVASKTGATVGDAVTFVVGLYNNAVGALHDADATWGGTTSAMTGDATAKTVQEVSLSLAIANYGTPGEPVTFSLKPTDGTLGTDDVIVESIRLVYRKKAAAS